MELQARKSYNGTVGGQSFGITVADSRQVEYKEYLQGEASLREARHSVVRV